MARDYTMTISRMTVDKLGVKLYDKVYAVIAELISNSYDADATSVTVKVPMGQYLATKVDGKVSSKNVTIEVEDNGIGMSPDEMQSFYLVVGKERRLDPDRGDLSRLFRRKVMGRKGVGKLAPFGVCNKVEIISAGGEKIQTEDGEFYRVAHIILDRECILSETDEAYKPETGEKDDSLSPETFTRVILRDFDFRRAGTMDELSRQLAQRFGIESGEWRITLVNSSQTESAADGERVIGSFDVQCMADTKIVFDGPYPTVSDENPDRYRVLNSENSKIDGITPGFSYDGRFFPVKGWVAYAKEPYKDELMSGIRIYCRGKYAAKTLLFNRSAGFTGEHSVRSYLIGELHADWLDEDEDLIQTDRRDILWSHELGEAFQAWGQSLINYIGRLALGPMRKTMSDRFLEVSKIEERAREEFSGECQGELRAQAKVIAKSLGKSLRGDELNDQVAIEELVQLSLLLAPVQALDKKLREASDVNTPLCVVNDILRTAKVAETVSFGRQVKKRLEIIDRLEKLKDDSGTPELELQDLIQNAPWLINPQWIPLSSNQALTTLKVEFAKFYKKNTGLDIQLENFSDKSKRPDFVMLSQDSCLQIVEIKRPNHKINNAEMDRIQTYFDQFELFLNDPRHGDFKVIASKFHITLVSDGESLSGVYKKVYKDYVDDKQLTPIDWASFLLRTIRSHHEFLEEAKRQGFK